MTGREIERMERSLPRWENGKPPVLTEEQKSLSRELSCRGMINCILLYHGNYGVREDSYFYNQYLRTYERELGHDCVRKLCQEQLEDFQKAVDCYAGRDDEGLSYRSITWADEMVDEALVLIENDLSEEGPENGTGYTLPDGRYHIFAYVDFIDEDRVIVLEPNKVVNGAHEPIFGDTFIVAFDDTAGLRKGLDWCLEQFADDRHGIDAILKNANSCIRSVGPEHNVVQDFLEL